VINTNLHPISRRFQVTADYWSNLRFRKGVSVSNTLVRDGRLNSGPRNLTLKKPEESLYRMVLMYWQTIISSCHNARVWQTDRRTDGQKGHSKSSLSQSQLRT